MTQVSPTSRRLPVGFFRLSVIYPPPLLQEERAKLIPSMTIHM